MTPSKYAKLVEQLARAEADMRRSFNRWEKIRGQVRRAEKTLDKAFAARAGNGSGDWRQLAGADLAEFERQAEQTGVVDFDDDVSSIGGGGGGDPSYEARVRALEDEGLTRSDAQGVVDAQDAAS